jgi:hypothetical protein
MLKDVFFFYKPRGLILAHKQGIMKSDRALTSVSAGDRGGLSNIVGALSTRENEVLIRSWSL